MKKVRQFKSGKSNIVGNLSEFNSELSLFWISSLKVYIKEKEKKIKLNQIIKEGKRKKIKLNQIIKKERKK